MPIRLELTLWSPKPDSPFKGVYTMEREEMPVDESEGLGVRVDVNPERPAESGPPRDRLASRWRSLRLLRPSTAAWADLSLSTEYVRTHRKTPVTDLVYRWLWRDLHKIGFLPNPPRFYD